MFLGLTSDDAADVRARRLRRDDDRAAHLDGRAACRRCRCRARRSTPSACRWIPSKLHARGASASTRSNTALQNWNVNLPTGQLFGPTTTYNIQADGQLMNADAFKPLIVAYRNGAPLRLDQVANVIDNVEDNKNASWLYTKSRRAARDQPAGDAAARQQHHRGHRRDPRAAADVPGSSCRRRSTSTIRGDRSKNIREAFNDIQCDDAAHAARSSSR